MMFFFVSDKRSANPLSKPQLYLTSIKVELKYLYRAFHRFGQAKFAYGDLVLGSSPFALLPQLPLKTMLGLKVVKN